MVAASGTLNFYREPGRLKVKPASFEAGEKRVWDGRFALAFAPFQDSALTVRQLGADGWLSYTKVMKEKGLSPVANRLAALTTPALWKGDRLMCAPLLGFPDPAGEPGEARPLEAALVPGLARFLTGIGAGAASALGKDTPIPYL